MAFDFWQTDTATVISIWIYIFYMKLKHARYQTMLVLSLLAWPVLNRRKQSHLQPWTWALLPKRGIGVMMTRVRFMRFKRLKSKPSKSRMRPRSVEDSLHPMSKRKACYQWNTRIRVLGLVALHPKFIQIHIRGILSWKATTTRISCFQLSINYGPPHEAIKRNWMKPFEVLPMWSWFSLLQAVAVFKAMPKCWVL